MSSNGTRSSTYCTRKRDASQHEKMSHGNVQEVEVIATRKHGADLDSQDRYLVGIHFHREPEEQQRRVMVGTWLQIKITTVRLPWHS